MLPDSVLSYQGSPAGEYAGDAYQSQITCCLDLMVKVAHCFSSGELFQALKENQ